MQAKRKHGRPRWKVAIVLAAFVASSLVLKAWHDTMRDPVVERVTIIDPAYDEPVIIAMLADIHVAGPDMPPARLQRIVQQVNRLQPDVVLIAGDFVSDKRMATRHYSIDQAIAPLAALRPDSLKIAVPGNHDHWRDYPAIRNALESVGIQVIANEVIRRRGLSIAGLDDDFTGHADLPATLRKMPTDRGPSLMLSHSPDPFPDLPRKFGIMLAGHTHCGQIGYPWGGSPATMSRYGSTYACGIVRENGNVLITSSGLGTSVLPFRLFTHPEIWVITLAPS